VIDASLALQWFLGDESERGYSLAILARLEDNEAVVPILCFYEVGNGLTMAHRHKRITLEQVAGGIYTCRARMSLA
jgi:predicted nucleic acid-binding protein